jgi:hypothetical protein
VIRAIGTAVRASEAVAILEASAPVSAEVERELFYPFHWFLLRSSAKTLFGTSALGVSCLVDARRRRCATADPFETEDRVVTPENIVEPTLAESDGLRIAERYASYVVQRRRSAFVRQHLEVVEQDLVYKPFWIVHCRQERSRPFRMLVDGVTGGFYPLPAPCLSVNS